jgi:hypothetical protein
MKRRVMIVAASVAMSLVIILGTMQMFCYFLNRVYGVPYPFSRVTWLAK